MGFIYKIWNDNNNKLYIGLTSVSVSVRWSLHIKKSNDLALSSALYTAIRKYGINSFHIQEIEECPNDLLNEREIFWISYYDSCKNGYNSTIGGTNIIPTGKKHQLLNNEIIFKYWDEGNSIIEISEKTGYSRTAIKEHLKEYPNYSIEESCKRGLKRSAEAKRMTVYLWDRNGNFVELYDSCFIASQKTNIEYKNINACLHNKRKTAGNFYWTNDKNPPNIKLKTKIYQYDLQGKLINIYNTKKEAALKVLCDPSTISKACKGLIKTCKGYKWEEK